MDKKPSCYKALLDTRAQSSNRKLLFATGVETKLGEMVAFSDDNHLYLLEFVNRKGIEKEISRLKNRLKVDVVPGQTRVSKQLKQELTDYFDGLDHAFKTPVFLQGTSFQKSVWAALSTIPYGETRSYLEIAQQLGQGKACRAVANANASNQFALIIPCHRVINANGKLGGYAGGLSRKSWLLNHELSMRALS